MNYVLNFGFTMCMALNLIMFQVTPEAKKKAAEAKSRADDAFRRKDYIMAVDAYTQVCTLLLQN